MTAPCLHIVASLNSKHGGPSRSIPGLCDAISACGKDVIVVSQKLHEEQDNDLLIPTNQRIKIRLINAIKRFGRTYTPDYKKQLSTIILKEQCNLIHSHGIWLQCNRQAAACARRLNVPHIVSTRGMLAPWAFCHNSWKKKPVWLLWQKRALQQATAFCATSDQEAKDIRGLGFRQPIAVIPNGVNLPVYIDKQERLSLKNKYALFLGRIHPVKGIYELVRAWAHHRPDGWKVIIAGPDENGHMAKVQKEISSLGLDTVFEFVGPVAGEQKELLFREAGLFLLPSFTENFGIAIAEALAAGTPVITTKGTPWAGLVTHNCGWWVDIGVDPLADAIRHATSLSDVERISMGSRGREYVLSEFGWNEIGRKMVSFYDWILNGGTPPDCVRLD